MSTTAIAGLAAFAWLAAALLMGGLWRWHLHLHRPGLADGAWPLVTAALAVLYATVTPGTDARHSAIAWMIGSWGARLGVYLLWDDAALNPETERVESIWLFQRRALEAVLYSLPALVVSVDTRETLSSLELAAAGLWVVGFAGETTADRQLVRWRRSRARDAAADVPEAPRDSVCRVGLWRYVPRAHDVFELITWTAHALFAWASPFGWIAVACPVAAVFRLATSGTRHAQL